MLDDNLKTQLKAYLAKATRPIEIVASLDDSDKSREMHGLLADIDSLSDKVSLSTEGTNERRPSFALGTPGEEIGITFAGLPMGHEFTSLVLALLQTGGHPSKASQELIDQIKSLDGEFNFETYVSLSCQNCPDIVQALNLMSVLNPNISHTMIEGGAFREEVERKEILSVPTLYLNGEHFGQGRMTLEEIVGKIDTGSAQREADKLNAKEPFDVLVIGGGPAGAAAAIYAARKGVRTGLVAERFGGQVQDTAAIENFISVKAHEGPRLVTELEEHVKDYDVDVMKLQRAAKLIPAAQEGDDHQVAFESGAVLKAKSVIVATGANWRKMGVPGEAEYNTRGVAYCPHCDGPLFKGKPVAVIGGGNSGVEAAIDLAGIVKDVTVLEFQDSLRADAVLQRKLESLPNVKVIKNAQTTEVQGDGKKVTALAYKDRTDGSEHSIDLDGVFVQIGLVPNASWLKGTVELTQHGEIKIDERGATSIPGVFAAGDVTTVPYKQIVIAVGEGAKASLSAFDHLIRVTAPKETSAEEAETV
ncbi:alkyl hydroperoxide reductase subunit F [Carnimonas bestiolae]|uniref:alkyl hydroperoxide reductase subunit F n=1 Tax=Carnimonas bestiolae TaxID=3402172 RepID=UPI003EDBF34E